MAQHIAYSVCWDLSKTSISYNALVDKCRLYGIKVAYIPARHSKVNAFRKAKSNLVASLKKELLSWSIKPVEDNPDRVVWQLNQEDGKHSKSYNPIANFEFRKKSGRIELRNVVVQDIADRWLTELQTEYENCQKHGTEDLRQLLSNWCDANAVRLRKGGGYYFAPTSAKSDIDNLIKLLADISPNSKLRIKRILAEQEDLPDHIEDVSQGLESEILAMKKSIARNCGYSTQEDDSEESNAIALLDKELDSFLGTASLPKSVRPKTTSKMISEYRDLQAKVDRISQELGFAADGLVDKLKSITQVLQCGSPPKTKPKHLQNILEQTPKPQIPVAVVPEKPKTNAIDSALDELLAAMADW